MIETRNRSPDVLRQTRRNAYTTGGAVPIGYHRMSCCGSSGSASLLRAMFNSRNLRFYFRTARMSVELRLFHR